MLEECTRTLLVNSKNSLAKEQARAWLLARYPTREDFVLFANEDVEGLLHNCLTVDEQHAQAQRLGLRKMNAGEEKKALQSNLRTISRKLKRWHEYLLDRYMANVQGNLVHLLHVSTLFTCIFVCRWKCYFG